MKLLALILTIIALLFLVGGAMCQHIAVSQ